MEQTSAPWAREPNGPELMTRELKAVEYAVDEGRFTDNVKALTNVAAKLGEEPQAVIALISALMSRQKIHMRARLGRVRTEPAQGWYVRGPD
jgi:hypothetical protein